MLRFVTFNMLSHGYTKHNSAVHGNGPARSLESVAQRDRRRALNAALVASVDADVLLLQEHDEDVSLPHYSSTITRAFVDGRSEGCSVAVKDGSGGGGIIAQWTLDLGDGKTAASALVHGVWFTSVHFKGGPGSEPMRREQAARLVARLSPTGPAVIAGDFNDTDPDSTVGSVLGPEWKRVPYEGHSGLNGGMTVPLAIDHVYVRDLEGATAAPMLPPKQPWLDDVVCGSDHVPIVVTLPLD
jgi:endonuclease/exonuclease/phosphatase family metal-dependent hydrolase